MKTIGVRLLCSSVLVALIALADAGVARARPDEQVIADFRAAYPQLFQNNSGGGGRKATPAAIPDIYGPGAVLNVGDVFLKITNLGLIGNPFTNLSSDPSMQWPGASGVEYLSFSLVAVGGVNPTATDPNAIRRVSYYSEWRPPTLEPVDHIYRAYDGIVNGQRLVNDDGDVDLTTGKPLIDEDFLDGHDNDGDHLIDEDYAALGQQMYSCVMRDDTPAAINSVFNEKHIPLGLEMRQVAWAYSVDGYTRFNPIEFTIYNRSGHTLDSMYFGLRTDMDCGPVVSSTYYSDDFDVPFFPSGKFFLPVSAVDPLLQLHVKNAETGAVDTLCAKVPIQVSGLSVVDDDGDEGKTPGIGSLLLLGHTVDPLGHTAPQHVQFRAVRSYIVGTPYQSGGNPTVDQQRYEFMSSTDNVDQATGAVTLEQGEQVGDYQNWMSVGPFRNVPDGGSFQVTVAFTVTEGSNAKIAEFKGDYSRYEQGQLGAEDLFRKYPALANAYAAQVAYQGVYEPPRSGFEDQVPNCHGCETSVLLPRGTPSQTLCEPCGGEEVVCKQVTEFATTWFNFDCDFCTGAWDERTNQGFYLRRWNAESPPPSPGGNWAASFNYSDNPNRNVSVAPAGDGSVVLAWDNLSETTADPKTRWFDFRSYRLWKVSNWTRPVGSAGPNDDDWALLGEFRMFDHAPNNHIMKPDPANPTQQIEACPTVWIPQRAESMQVCLNDGDLWDNQSGVVIRPDPTVDCIRKNGPNSPCVQDSGLVLGTTNQIVQKSRYPVGRYKYVDREVKNGFLYFYAVTAGDSVCVKKCEDDPACLSRFPTKRDSCIKSNEFFGRVSGVESEAVTPQAGTKPVGGVWVVPNPYRGYSDLARRPSSWDLTPNASDPTGTHVDFMGLPSSKWKIRIYTVSGDLVAELHSDDAVNADLRPAVLGSDGKSRPGYNRQQDNANDGQARWNLISRNGQDVVSGIYVFVVESDQGQQRGRFVIIR